MPTRLFLIITALWPVLLVGQPTGFLTSDTEQSRNQVLHDLKSGDGKSIDRALRQVHYWLDNGSVSTDLWNDWLPALMKVQRYQDVADCALLAVLNVDDVQTAENCMKLRAQALLELNKPQPALQAAKSYYNICRIKNLDDAVELLATCLGKCYPNNSNVIDRFRSEQAVSGNSSVPAGTVIRAIQVDDALFADAIERRTFDPKDARHLTYGNLLLVADRCAEAEKVFRENFRRAETRQQLTSATDGIARCLKAEDGNAQRANQWMQLSGQQDKQRSLRANESSTQSN